MRIDVNNLTLFGVDLHRPLRWWLSGLQAGAAPLREAFFHPVPRLRIELGPATADGIAPLDFRVLAAGADDWREIVSIDSAALALMADGALRQQLLGACGERAALAQVELALPLAQVLRRPLSLPAAVRDQLREVVGYQLSRLTPFQPEQLHFDVREREETPAEEGMLALELLAIPADSVDPLLAQLERVCGFTVSRLTVAAAEGEGVNLFGRPRAGGGWLQRLNGNAGLLALLALLIGALLLTSPLKKRALVVERKQEIARLDRDVSHLLAQRQQLERDISVLNHIVERRVATPLPSAVIAELSRATPDGVYLANLRIHEGRVEFRGFGTEVVELIRTLEESPLLEEVQFTSAVTRDNRSGLDQFAASARLVMAGAVSEPAP